MKRKSDHIKKVSIYTSMLLYIVTAAGCSLGPADSDDEYVDGDQRQSYTADIENRIKPEVTEVIFSGKCERKLETKTDIADLYAGNIQHSSVVGLMGVPVRLSYEDVADPEICFVYNEKYLGQVPEKNLIMLHYNEADGKYDTVNGFVLNEDQNMVSASITEDGVYLLADAYQWYSCWGMDVSEYEYDFDPAQTISIWERGGNTGSIMLLADKRWAVDNAPVFHVSTPQQLASVVYYVNSFNESKYQIILEDDIDLTGYDWRPIGWTGGRTGEMHRFSGTVDGQNHTITGMTIDLGYEDCGFIGYGSGVDMRDITFASANVTGSACTGICGGEIYGSGRWENVQAIGIVTGGDEDYGGLVGRETGITFKDCHTKTKVNGEESPWFSYRQRTLEETEVTESFTLKLNDDMTITRDEQAGFEGLGWEILLDGELVMQRGILDNELTLDTEYQWLDGKYGTHTIYLVAYINGTYIRVSNIIEYTIDKDTDPYSIQETTD